ncbi:MAG: VOC family protein [Candidatus Eremiobacteraeota bacterium]|nr:VOC family protein [Candidatus Eremiobacteraeota bacterium]
MPSARGLGGVFLRADDPAMLASWYEEQFGFKQEFPGGMILSSKDVDGRDAITVFSFFARDNDHFAPEQQAMINLRVDDLDATLNALRGAGVRVESETMDDENGRFGWCYDPEGNKVELWEPRG